MDLSFQSPAMSGAILNDPSSVQKLVNRDDIPQNEKVATVAREFEGLLLKQFLEPAMRPLLDNSLMGGTASDIYRKYITDSMVSSVMDGGGIGISSLVQQQLTQPDHEA